MMRRDYKLAIKELVDGICTGDYEDACRNALEALDSDMAALVDEDEASARRKVSDEGDEGEDESFDPSSLEDEEF